MGGGDVRGGGGEGGKCRSGVQSLTRRSRFAEGVA